MQASSLELLLPGLKANLGAAVAMLKWNRVEMWLAVAPVITYWLVALYFDACDHSTSTFVARHRIVRREPGRQNSLSRGAVVTRVLLQHGLQLVMTAVVMVLDPAQCSANPPRGWLSAAAHFIIAMFIMDTWQYWIHRAMHTSTFLYKHLHATHHQLWCPYAYGALYNHPLEALLLDTLGAGVAMLSLGMTCECAIGFFCFSTAKTVMDHSNYRWPINPLHNLFPNSAAYHDVHHDVHGLKANFSQPFFIMWDVLMGTYMDPATMHISPKQVEQLAVGSWAPTASASSEVAAAQAAVRGGGAATRASKPAGPGASSNGNVGTARSRSQRAASRGAPS